LQYTYSENMKYSPRFYPEKRGGIEKNVPIMLSVSYEKKRMIYYTGKRCNIDQWEKKLQLLKPKQKPINNQTLSDFNSDIERIKIAVNDLFKEYDLKKTIPEPEQLRADLKKKLGKKERIMRGESFFERFEQYTDDVDVCPKRRENIKALMEKVRKFNPSINFNAIDTQFLDDFDKNLLKSMSKNTAICNMKMLKAFYNYANTHFWTTANPFNLYRIEKEVYGDPVYITREERDKIFEVKLNNPSMAYSRDIFIFQCYIGCRFGDLVKMTKSNIVNGNIEYIATKTLKEKSRIISIPLTERALEILGRYDMPDGALLPFVSKHFYNSNLKKIFSEAEINRIVTIPNRRTRKSIQIKICDLASSHMARRVFIGSLFKKGANLATIASMSGHSLNSRAFGRYFQIDNEDKKKAIDLIK